MEQYVKSNAFTMLRYIQSRALNKYGYLTTSNNTHVQVYDLRQNDVFEGDHIILNLPAIDGQSTNTERTDYYFMKHNQLTHISKVDADKQEILNTRVVKLGSLNYNKDQDMIVPNGSMYLVIIAPGKKHEEENTPKIYKRISNIEKQKLEIRDKLVTVGALQQAVRQQKMEKEGYAKTRISLTLAFQPDSQARALRSDGYVEKYDKLTYLQKYKLPDDIVANDILLVNIERPVAGSVCGFYTKDTVIVKQDSGADINPSLCGDIINQYGCFQIKVPANAKYFIITANGTANGLNTNNLVYRLKKTSTLSNEELNVRVESAVDLVQSTKQELNEKIEIAQNNLENEIQISFNASAENIAQVKTSVNNILNSVNLLSESVTDLNSQTAQISQLATAQRKDNLPPLIYGTITASAGEGFGRISASNNSKKFIITSDFYYGHSGDLVSFRDNNPTEQKNYDSIELIGRVFYYDNDFNIIQCSNAVRDIVLTRTGYIRISMYSKNFESDGKTRLDIGLGYAAKHISITSTMDTGLNNGVSFSVRERLNDNHRTSVYDKSAAINYGYPPTDFYNSQLKMFNDVIDAQSSKYIKTSANQVALYDDILNAYDTLYEKYKDTYITKNLLGSEDINDETGQGGDKIYQYVFKPVQINTHTGVATKQMPKILIITGTQGSEQVPIISLYYLMKDMVENSTKNSWLSYMRSHLEIHIVPTVSPWGIKNYKYYNYNKVSLNRNYDTTTWKRFKEVEQDEPKENYYNQDTGEAPADQKENQIIQKWIKQNSDAALFIDFHVQTEGNLKPSEWYKTFWIAPMRLKDDYTKRFAYASASFLYEINNQFKQKYNLTTAATNPCPQDLLFGYITPPTSNSVAKNFAGEQNILATTFEVVSGYPCDVTEDGKSNPKSPDMVHRAVEGLGNFIRHIMLEYVKKGD